MSQQLAHVLQGALALREAEAIVSGRPAPTWLFPDARGGPLNHRSFLKSVWRPLLTRAGLPYRPPHQLRQAVDRLDDATTRNPAATAVQAPGGMIRLGQ